MRGWPSLHPAAGGADIFPGLFCQRRKGGIPPDVGILYIRFAVNRQVPQGATSGVGEGYGDRGAAQSSLSGLLK